MIRVQDVKSGSPATHALVIGVGGYPGLHSETGDGLPTAYDSALLIANWLRQDFSNPAAPLATLDLLISAPSGSELGRDGSGFEQPTFRNVQTAAAAWFNRCDSHPDNIALFYFTGYGTSGLETLLLLDDVTIEPPSSFAPSFVTLLSSMRNCRARKQVYFLDMANAPADQATAVPLLDPTIVSAVPPSQVIYKSPLIGGFGVVGQPSFFSRALIDTLVNAPANMPTGALSTMALVEPINGRLARMRLEVGLSSEPIRAEVGADWALHYPRVPRPPAAAPAASAKGGEELAITGTEGGARFLEQRSRGSAPSGTGAKPSGEAMLIGLNEASLKKLLARARKRGYLTYDELNDALPQDHVPPDQIESVMAALVEMGVRVVEFEEPDAQDTDANEPGADRGDPGGFPAFILDEDALDGGPAAPKGETAPPGEDPGEAASALESEGTGIAGDLPASAPTSPAPAPLIATDVETAPPEISTSAPGARPASGAGAGNDSRTKASDTEFVADDAETERDSLGRSVLAIGLARRLHRIWRASNEARPNSVVDDDRAAFVVHLDSPWGGGKTTFANYLARVLDPLPGGRDPADFLKERYGEVDLGGIFLEDPPADEAAKKRLAELPAEARRPWIVVPFNAWQVEHCAPPWWVFYQTIRKSCFDAIRKDGDLPWRPGDGPRRLPGLQRLDAWAKLWLSEIGWRLTNPKVRSLLVTAAVSFVLLLLLQRFGIWGLLAGKDPKTGFLLTSAFGLALGGLTTITFLWGMGALFTESIVPGTDTLAERLSLGSGDPFDRFRRHFARTIARVRRPVMVVVDDLDRCRPDFVVGLVRGMQTLLRSPRVVFVILGDRDWIERAFEAHHKTMEKVDVGPEQTFGARFVEKAIQMSFILPAMGDESRRAYVGRILAGTAPRPGQSAEASIDADTVRTVRELVNREAAAPGSDPFDTDRILTRAMEEVALPKEGSDRDEAAFQAQVEQLVGETLAIHATTSERVDQGVAHQLEALAEHFPANPRQIKRIVNAITIYYAVALQRPDLNPDEAFRTQLALWIIIMTEWPGTWRLLASFPSLVGILQAADPIAAVKAQGAVLPGSPEATERVIRQILADPELTALIRGGATPPLDPARVRLLAQLTPLHSRKRRLEDAPKAGEREEPAR